MDCPTALWRNLALALLLRLNIRLSKTADCSELLTSSQSLCEAHIRAEDNRHKQRLHHLSHRAVGEMATFAKSNCRISCVCGPTIRSPMRRLRLARGVDPAMQDGNQAERFRTA